MTSTTTFSVSRCRQLLDEDSEELNDAFLPEYDQTLASRLELFENGTARLALDIIKKDSPKHTSVIKDAWTMFCDILIIRDVDDERENLPIDKFSEMDGFPCLAKEFERRLETKTNVGNMLVMLAWCATNINVTPAILGTGIHKRCIDYVKQGEELAGNKFDTSMSFIRAASACHSTRVKLRADGALDVVIPFLDDLKKDDDLSLRRGFRAASVVARLAGMDETGIGPQILRGNPVLIKKTIEILDRVLNAGPKDSVIGMLINPHFITMDLLTISTSDANKPLLKDAIPILIKAIKLRGETNEEMVVDIVKTLLQLTYDKECLRIMDHRRDDLLGPLQRLVIPPKYNMETLVSAINLYSAISTSNRSGVSPSKSSMLGGLMRRSNRDLKDNKERRKSNTLASTDKHVMLSHNWSSKQIVHRVDDLLRSNGIKTWLDDRDMGANLNDSMANAIEDAYVLFAFMTSRYKESANCRKECEYADDRKVPIVYLMAEEGYKPNGWLGLQLGKSVWIGCWQEEMVDQNLPKLLQAAKPGSGKVAFVPQPVKSPATTSTKLVTKATATATTATTSNSAPSDLLALLNGMKGQLDSMMSSLEQLKTNQEALKQGQESLRTNQETIKTNQTSLQTVVKSIEKSLDGVKHEVAGLVVKHTTQ